MGNSVFLDLQDFCMGLQYATLIQDINAQKQQIVKYLYTWFFFLSLYCPFDAEQLQNPE